MDKALLAGLLVAELVASACRPDDGSLVCVRLLVGLEASGTRVGIEISGVAANNEILVANSGLGLLGVLEDALGTALSIDAEGRRITASFLLGQTEARTA